MNIQKIEPLDNISKENKSKIIRYVHKIGGMEIFSRNEVNPGCMTKMLMLEFSQGKSHQQNKNKKTENL